MNILLISFVVPAIVSVARLDPTALSSGQTQYQELALKASLPKYGPCWMSALSQLGSTCNQLTEASQARLALEFTNCFLAQAGQRQYPCDEDQEMGTCLKDVDNNAFTAYSNFYTHTQNMCYFLKSQEWQEVTDSTINRLSSSSARVAQQMEESLLVQREIQAESLEYQKQLAENGGVLNEAISASKENVRGMLEEFKRSTNEQKHLLFEVFDRVSTLQNLVITEVSWIYTVVFYSTCLLVIYLVTSTKRTADSRLWLFLILTINFGLERFVIWLSLPENTNIQDISEMVNRRVWMVRNAAIFMSIFLMSVMAMKFKDFNLINNALLEEIKKQNFELKRSMETFQVGNKLSQAISTGTVDVLDGHLHSISNMLAEDTGFVGDEEDFSDTDSDSFNSTRTDITFNPANQSFSDSNFGTAATSRETTPTNENMCLEALNSSFVHSTPAKLEKSVNISNPAAEEPRYNLRSRSRNSMLNNTVDESPETFAKLVKEQLHRSKRNYSKWKMAVGRQKEEFSEDENL